MADYTLCQASFTLDLAEPTQYSGALSVPLEVQGLVIVENGMPGFVIWLSRHLVLGQQTMVFSLLYAHNESPQEM